MINSQPNILLMNCDDLGYGDLACYGSQVNATPALDRLAAEGTRFTDFYMAASICSPSRAGLLTGCYPQRISLNRVLFPADPDGLHKDETTIAALLKRQGYATALVGKWHLGDQPEFLPCRFGFDRYYGLPYSNDMGRQAGMEKKLPPLPLMLDNGIVEEQPDQAGLTERYVEEAVRFMRASASANQPFFLYLAHMYVHRPLYVPDRFMRESRNGRYGAAVACVDWAWDRLDHELRQLGLADNTIVLFTSDNGSRGGAEGGSNAPFRGGKFSTWEGGFRLPLLARWPGRIPAGRVCREVVAAMDLLPTLTACAGASPMALPLPIDGLDCSALLTGKTDASPRDTFAYYFTGNLAAVRKGKWKLHFSTRVGGGKPFAPLSMLCDLENDIAEQRDASAAHPEVIADLNAVAERFRRELGDAFTGAIGSAVRPCGIAANPVPLTTYDPRHPYIMAEYDLPDRG